MRYTPCLRFASLIAAGLLLLSLSRPTPAEPPEGRWTENYSAGLRQAKADAKPVLLMFSASWCGPCNRMKKEVFPKDTVKRTLANWVDVYIDGDKERDLMEMYKVEAFPTFVLLNSEGKELGRFVGGVGAETFVQNINILTTDLPRLKKQLDGRPKDPALWKKQGQLLEAIGDIDGAVKAYRKAADLDPKNVTGAATDIAFFEAARVREDGPAGADRRFYDFLKRYPNSPRAEDALFNRARIAFDDRRFNDTKTLLGLYQKKYPKGKYADEAKGILDYLAKENPPEGGAAPQREGAAPPRGGSVPSVPRQGSAPRGEGI